MAPDSTTRASDRDRDTVVRLLGEQAALGRLTPAELDQRTDAALTARTCGELHALTVDLPVEPSPHTEHAEHPEPRRRWLSRCLACLAPLALMVLAGNLGAAAPVAALVGIVLCVAIGAKTAGSLPTRWCR